MWKCPSLFGSRLRVISSLTIEIFFPRHCESYQMLLPFCTENGSLSASSGDNHFPSRDLSLHAQATCRASFGKWTKRTEEGAMPTEVTGLWLLSEERWGGVVTQVDLWCRKKGVIVWWTEDGQGTSNGLTKKIRLCKHSMYQKFKKVSN